MDKSSRNLKLPRYYGKYVLHPLIHTSLRFAQAQDVEKKKAEPKTPHFCSLNQDVVAWSEEENWGLKYVIHSTGDQPGLQIITPSCSCNSNWSWLTISDRLAEIVAI